VCNLEKNINEKSIEILTDSDHKNTAKEILTTMQLILCDSHHLPLHIIEDLFESLIVIMNSVSKIIENIDGRFWKINI
jgi:hypothetical protein